MKISIGDDLLDEREAAEILGVSVRALQTWRYKNIGPDFLHLGPRLIRYRVGDLAGWLENQKRKPTNGVEVITAQ